MFSALYQEHIAMEETVVYPAAQTLLRNEQAGMADRRTADS